MFSELEGACLLRKWRALLKLEGEGHHPSEKSKLINYLTFDTRWALFGNSYLLMYYVFVGSCSA